MLLQKLLPDGVHECDVVVEVVSELLVGLLPMCIVVAEGGGGVPMLLHSFVGCSVSMVAADFVLVGHEALFHHVVGGMPFDLGDLEGSGRFGGELSPEKAPEIPIGL